MLTVAGSASLRQQNRSLVLAALRERGPLAHTDIAEWSGLSSATVSAITTDLLAEDIIRKSESPSPSGRGRPRVLLAQNPEAAYIATIRITSEALEYSLADYAGTLKDRFSEKRPAGETDTTLFAQRLYNGMERLQARSQLVRDKIRIISITSKGLVSPGRAVLLWSPVFGGQQIDFEALLTPHWPARITLTNETHFVALALAIKRRIADPQYGIRLSATLSLGHNIGLGIATETPGRVISVATPAFGHMNHMPDGPLCRCGARGCIEAYAGFYGILRSAFEMPEQTIPANFVPLVEIDKIANNARAGNRMAEFAFRRAGETLGTGVSRLMSLYGPMPLAITGPGLKNFDLMYKGFEEPMRSNLMVRFGKMPEISMHEDESTLVFEGNVEGALSYLDSNYPAAGRMGG